MAILWVVGQKNSLGTAMFGHAVNLSASARSRMFGSVYPVLMPPWLFVYSPRFAVAERTRRALDVHDTTRPFIREITVFSWNVSARRT